MGWYTSYVVNSILVHYMRKWIIFISIVILVSVAVFLFSLFPDIFKSEVSSDPNASVAGRLPVRFLNVSEYDISPGVLVVHDSSFSMNFLGASVPKEYESLAAAGDPSPVLLSLDGADGVYQVFEVGPIAPGSIEKVTLSSDVAKDASVSYMAMIAQKSGGVVWLNQVPLYTAAGVLQSSSILTEVLATGVERVPVGSIFSGEQPDLLRGVGTIDGDVVTTTVAPVQHHPQFYDDGLALETVVRIDINR